MTDQPTPNHAKPKRILTGLQPSGQLHLGNYAGAIRQLLDMQDAHAGNMFVFVATYHAMTSTQDAQALRDNTKQIVIDYLAFGLDPEKVCLYRQQDVPQVTELAWILGCTCPKSYMEKATTYKDKVAKGLPASIGLFTYPVLQAADILAVDAELVPVGEDQKQHLEMTRDLAQRFNHAYGDTFTVPEFSIRTGAGILPGLDGQKMSKSYGNDIDPFLPEKKLRKTIMKIVTDSAGVEDVKDPETDTTYAIFRGLAGDDASETKALAERYRAGGMGYGEAKQTLFEYVMDHFGPARERREKLLADPSSIDAVLADGAKRAGEVIGDVTARVRQAAGL